MLLLVACNITNRQQKQILRPVVAYLYYNNAAGKLSQIMLLGGAQSFYGGGLPYNFTHTCIHMFYACVYRVTSRKVSYIMCGA